MQISHQRPHRGMTLIEMMCVIAIIALLSVLAHGARSHLAHSAVNSGTSLLYNGLGLARQTALQRNTTTIFALRTTGEYAWQRFAIFKLAPDTGRWEAVSGWQNLPRHARMDNAYILPESWTHTIGLAAASQEMTAPTEPLRDPSQTPAALGLNTDYIAVGFRADGCLIPSDNNIALRIVSAQAGDRTQWPVLVTESSAGRVKVLW